MYYCIVLYTRYLVVFLTLRGLFAPGAAGAGNGFNLLWVSPSWCHHQACLLPTRSKNKSVSAWKPLISVYCVLFLARFIPGMYEYTKRFAQEGKIEQTYVKRAECRGLVVGANW